MTSRGILTGRRVLWYGLGGLWLLDGALQLQPAMTDGQFVQSVLLPTASGQPEWLRQLVLFGASAWQRHPLTCDAAAALIQLSLGVGILFGWDRVLGRAALWASIAWGLSVWVFGEGMGGVLTPSPTALTGAPGAALLYAACAALLLLPVGAWTRGDVGRALRPAFGIYWLVAAVWQSIPSAGFWTPQGLTQALAPGAMTPEPGFLAAPIGWFLYGASFSAPTFNIVLTGGMAAAFWATVRAHSRRSLAAAAAGLFLWLGFCWWIGQDFGVLGGAGTDPNTAPVLALLAATAWLPAQWANIRRAPAPDGRNSALQPRRFNPRIG